MNSELSPNNFLLINKPAGWTSFDVVNYVRKKIMASFCHPEQSEGSLSFAKRDSSVAATLAQNDNCRKAKRIKVGHAGTLDPFATGLLIVGVGREATKRLDEFKNLPKTYVATLKLGEISDTFDVTGTIQKNKKSKNQEISEAKKQFNNLAIEQLGNEIPTREQILICVNSFIGRQLQTPPMFSAKKINGQRLYKLARQGKTIERRPDEIEIYYIKLIDYTWPLLKIEVACSSGTYIRSLANDIGEKLGVGAYCQELTRTSIGEYKLENAKDIV